MPSGSGPPPEHIQAFLRQPRPAIIGSLLADGSPSTVVTWYLWLGGARLLLSMQEDGFRERNLARDGRVSLTVLGEDWYTTCRSAVAWSRCAPIRTGPTSTRSPDTTAAYRIRVMPASSRRRRSWRSTGGSSSNRRAASGRSDRSRAMMDGRLPSDWRSNRQRRDPEM